MSSFMPQSYVYVHIGVLLCGLWAIASATSTDAVIMVSSITSNLLLTNGWRVRFLVKSELTDAVLITMVSSNLLLK